jgi:hypothetical protein
MAGQHGGARPGAGRKKGPAAFRRTGACANPLINENNGQ